MPRILYVVLVSFWIWFSASVGRAELEVFGSFEDPAEVAAVKPGPGVGISASTRFPAWGGNSLEVVFPPPGGTLDFAKIPSDWRWQESLLVFVWSQQPAEIELSVKDSAAGVFSKTFNLRTGVNHLQMILSEIRNVNRQAVRTLAFTSKRGGTFYLDCLALDRYHPVLEQRGRWDINYSMDVETPHVPWGRPLAGGPIKVYAIADVADGRGVIELAQRLELDFKATTIGSSPGTNKWGFGDFYEQRSSGGEFWKDAYSLAHTYIADDLINGPAYDVILWPGLHPWESYPAEIREALQKRVENGTGLVLFYPFSKGTGNDAGWNPSPLVRTPDIKSEDSNNFFRNRFAELDHSAWKPEQDHYITRGVPFDAFPYDQMAVSPSKPTGQLLLKTTQGTPVLAVNTAGRGRIVAFGYGEKGMIPEIQNVFESGRHYPYQEYLWSLVARAVVWAAQRESSTIIRDVIPSTSSFLAHVEDLPLGAQLQATVRNNFGETEVEGSASSVPGNRSLEFNLPKLQGGRHFVELRLLQKNRVLDWSTAVINNPAQVTLQSVKPETDRVRAGQEVPVRLRLSSDSETECVVTARMLDNYDRLLDLQQFTLTIKGEAERTLRLKTLGALTHLAKVDCEVSVDGRRSDRSIAEVFVLQPRQWDDYDIVMYRFGPDPIPGIWPAIDRQMKRLNVTTLSSYSVNHSKHANYNVQAQTRISGQESPDGPARNYYSAMKKKYLATGDKKVMVREYCLDDPAYKELIKKELATLTAPWVPFSPMSYYVFEEPSLTCYGDAVDICFSPHTLKAMRQWLQGVYGSLGELNRHWGSDFKIWDAVMPDDTPEAQKRGNYASWADHRTYMEKTYAENFAFVLQELRKIDPEGILLNSGTQISGSHNGCDYSRINRFTRHLNAYDDGNQLDFHRCFSPDLKISGGAGYGVLGKDVFYNFYNNLFKGSNGGAYIFWQYSTLDPDLTMSQSGKDMEAGFRELRGEGIGKLVGLATPDNHGIAIHYSYPSIHGTWILDGKVKEEVSYNTSKSFDRFNDNRDGWVKILKDSGLQFDFIAYSDVEQGGLTNKGYRTFILPMSVALSDKEVTAIREFVRQGGNVIADALPGIMDDHCTFRSNRVLTDVFGFRAPPANRENVLMGTVESQLQPTTARSLSGEGSHDLLANRFGQGKAYLLNYFLNRYPQDKLERKNAPALQQMGLILRDAGIQSKIRLTSQDGKPVEDCATFLFNNGSTRLLGLIPGKKMTGSQKVRLAFDGVSAVYDVRERRYIGSASAFETEIEPAVPRLFAMVDGTITGLETSGPSQVKPGDEVNVAFLIQGMKALRSVAKAVVTDPGGEMVSYYGRNVDIIEGKGSIRFRTALNDKKGPWKVSVTEVISGKQGILQFRIQ